jgi:hypothetical protein
LAWVILFLKFCFGKKDITFFCECIIAIVCRTNTMKPTLKPFSQSFRKKRKVREEMPSEDEEEESSGAAEEKKVCFSRSTILESGHFVSVLDHPFNKWNDIDIVISIAEPEWGNQQRGCVIRQLINFLELKVVMDDYTPGPRVLDPSSVVAKAWKALLLETKLYQRVCCIIQDFHGRTRQMIHHSLTRGDNDTGERLSRTQALFHSYFGGMMPTTIDDIEIDSSSVLSSLTTGPKWSLPNALTACSGISNVHANESVDLVNTEIGGSPSENSNLLGPQQRANLDPWMRALKETLFCNTGAKSSSGGEYSIVTPADREPEGEDVEVLGYMSLFN